jgi:hypothetical protein
MTSKPRKSSFGVDHLVGVILGVSIGLIPILWALVGPPKFWFSYVGKTEQEIVQSLGEPAFNYRIIHPDYKPGDEYYAYWVVGFGGRLVIDFDANGKAVDQYRNDK